MAVNDLKASIAGWLTQHQSSEKTSSSSYSSETSFDSGMSESAAGGVANSGSNHSNSSNGSCPVFVAQTEDHVLTWEAAPWTANEWAQPKERINLVQTRVLCAEDHHQQPPQMQQQPQKQQAKANKITLRYGGEHGIQCYVFQVIIFFRDLFD